MGEKHKTRSQRPGYNTYKTVMALRMASRLNGVTAAEMAVKAGCSNAAALFTLKHLVYAGEVAKENEEGEVTRFHSDVYADVPNCKLIRFADMPKEINPSETYKSAVASVTFEAITSMAEQYPVAVFGERGRFIVNLLNAVHDRILKGFDDIT